MPLPSLRLCSDEPAPLTALPEPTGLANRHALGGETGGRCGEWLVKKSRPKNGRFRKTEVMNESEII